MDEPEKMRLMNAWLDQACTALELDREQVRAVQPALLKLVADVAHGPSRPGAPLTAFLIGVAAGRRGDLPDAVPAEVARLQPLLRAAREQASAGPDGDRDTP